MSKVPSGARLVGFPAKPIKQFFREVAMLERLARRGGADEKPTGSGEDS
jgi:UDP-3-O-[3-hydroxymyristoyl] glucosamine N-acyltransferase